jgi:hypothetical protein
MSMADREPNWSQWKHIPTVTLLEGVALSLNIEPKNLCRDWTLETRVDEGREFDDRLFLAKRCLGKTLAIAHFVDVYDDPVVKLRDFAAWALSVGWPLPGQFSELGAPDQASVALKSSAPPASVSASPSTKSKIEAAARELIAAGRTPTTCGSWPHFIRELLVKLDVTAGTRGYGDDSIQNAVRPLLEALRKRAR